MKRHAWGHEKASLVLGNETRGGVGFEECVAAIEDNRILDIVENENYPGQKMYVLDINSYAYVVPFVESEDEIFSEDDVPQPEVHQEVFEAVNGKRTHNRQFPR